MNDFITLSCPNCGGKLEVSPNTLSLVCQYCGIEHLVRREAGGILLEAFARCPVCKRNDRAERISAIVDDDRSNMADKLSPPFEPTCPSDPGGFGCWWIVIVFITIITPMFFSHYYLSSAFDNDIASIISFLFIWSFLIFYAWLVLRYLNRKNEQLIYKRKEAPDYKQKLAKYEELKKEWEYAIRRWKELYYCRRDGIIYNPKTGETCDPGSLKEFVYKQP